MIIKNYRINIPKMADDFFSEIEKELGNKYEIEKSQYFLKFKIIFFYHNRDRSSYIINSLNPLRRGYINISIRQNEITISSKLNHKCYLVRSVLVGSVISSFIYLSFNFPLLQVALMFLCISAIIGLFGIIYSEIKINKIIKDSYDRLKN